MTAQLIDGTSGAHVWGEHYNIAASQLVSTQDDIVYRIASTLFSEVRQTEKATALRSSPESFDVYTLALKGLALKHQFTPQAYREGRRVLQRAISLDPTYAPAFAYLGYLDAADCAADYSGEKRPEDIDDAIRLIHDAIRLDPGMAYAYQALGFALSVKGNAKDALAATEKAVMLGPGDADNQMLHGRELATNSQFAAAVVTQVTRAGHLGRHIDHGSRHLVGRPEAAAGTAARMVCRCLSASAVVIGVSMKPGATTCPSASITSLAPSRILPIVATFPSIIPTSARIRGIPEPSITVPFLMRRSYCMRPPLHGGVRRIARDGKSLHFPYFADYDTLPVHVNP
ncbi:MAG: tetratricopeptide repeat protein [Rhodospirillales bacterium]|nr:tetratricopeptide repeat protein [Rhodospirillales bacterium]